MTNITGTIRRIDGAVVPNAVVRLTLPRTAYKGGDAYLESSIAEVITDSSGNFTLPIVPNSIMATRSPMILEIFDGPVRLEQREVYIPERDWVTLEEITAYGRELLFKSPQNKFQGVFLEDSDTTATFEFIGAAVQEEDLTISIGGISYTIPTYLINGGQG